MDMDMGGQAVPSGSSSLSARLDSGVRPEFACLDPGVRLERHPAPTWLKVLLLLVHLVPLVLITATSGLFAGITPASGLVVARALAVLVLIVAVAELVENSVLVPLCARAKWGAKLPSLLLSCRGVALGRADQRMFHSWSRTKFTALQCVLIVAVWWNVWWNAQTVWNVPSLMGHGGSWGSRVYNGLVPNLLVCTLVVRAFFRQQWQERAFEDIG